MPLGTHARRGAHTPGRTGSACSGQKQAPTNQLGHEALTAEVKYFQNRSPEHCEVVGVIL